jgi:hypothetical protein
VRGAWRSGGARRARLILFLATFAAWVVTAALAMFTPECADPLGGNCATNWASGAATAAVWVALALTGLAVVVGIAHALRSAWRGWRERGELP